MKRISLLLMGVALGCVGMISPLHAQIYDNTQQDTLRQRGMYHDSTDMRDTSMYNDTYHRRNSTFDQDSVRQRGNYNQDTTRQYQQKGTYDTDTTSMNDRSNRGYNQGSGTQSGEWKSSQDSSWRRNSDTTFRSGSTGGYQGGTQSGTQSGQWKSGRDTSSYQGTGGYQSGTQDQNTGTQGGSKSKRSKSGKSGYKSGQSDTMNTYKSGNGTEDMSGKTSKSGQKSRRSGGMQGGMMSQLGTPTHSETNNGLSMNVWLVPSKGMEGRMEGRMGGRMGKTSDTSGTQGGTGEMGQTSTMGGTTSGEPGTYRVIMQIRDEDNNKDITSGTANLKVKTPSDKSETVKLKRTGDHFTGNVRLNETGTYSFTSNVKASGKNAESTFEFTTQR